MNNDAITSQDIDDIYIRRLTPHMEYRVAVWRTICRWLERKWNCGHGAVLDLGCGFGEFINNIQCHRKYAMDVNPDVKAHINKDVNLVIQDCGNTWALDDNSLDIVFTSNLLEHVTSRTVLLSVLREANRCLRTGGKLIAIGPNIKLLGGKYWDFFDHIIPLTEYSLSEALEIAGFNVTTCFSAFLPYTMSDGKHYPLWMVRCYLTFPVLWHFAGRQFFIIAEK